MGKYNLELYRIKANLCKTLADPTRQMMITELRGGEKTVGELAAALEINQPTASHHLAVLRDGGVVTARRVGASVYYNLVDSTIIQACDLVQGFLMKQMEKNKETADRVMS